MVDSTNLPEVDINQIATDLNGKMDRDGVNASCPTLLNRTPNSYGGVVEIWSDGYCVQTGIDTTGSGLKTVTLSQPYINTNYRVIATSESENTAGSATTYSNRTTSTFKINKSNTYTSWRTEGYIR